MSMTRQYNVHFHHKVSSKKQQDGTVCQYLLRDTAIYGQGR